MSVKQAAALYNVSERSIYMMRRLKRSGRDDLLTMVQSGEMALYKAVQIADGREPPTRIDKLFTAWRLCSPEDRETFLIAIGRFP